MGEMPMPPDCSYEMMCLMYDSVQDIENKSYAAEQLRWYESLWNRYKPQYDAAQDDKNYISIMQLIKQGILHWREELVS
jgi:hypothetical protein